MVWPFFDVVAYKINLVLLLCHYAAGQGKRSTPVNHEKNQQLIENIAVMRIWVVATSYFQRFLGRGLAASILFYICVINMPVTYAVEISSDPRPLEWEDLVPPGWEPPMIAPAYGGANENLVDSGSLVDGLNGLLVKLPGFLRPVVYGDGSVTEFLLVPFLPHHVKQHAHLEPNQMVYVVLDKPTLVDNPFKPFWVTGTISLQTVVTDDGPAGYKITNAEIQEYVY